MTTVLLTLLAFLLGAIPFSPLIGRLALGTDIRRYGDRNPGATNVLRAGGRAWGGLALMLDIGKGALPAGAAWELLGIKDWQIVPIALAPILGHAFSPLLRFHGGKAVATTFGIWIGLSFGEAALVLLIFLLLFYAVLTIDGWAVVLAMVALLAYLVLYHPAPPLIAVWAGNTLLLAWKHRRELRRRPSPRRWLTPWERG